MDLTLKERITRDDLIKSGACSGKVDAFCEKHNVYSGKTEDILSLCNNSQAEYVLRASNGDGDGYGDGYGYGYGDGYGYGYGDGYGYGNGNGYGNGYRNGDGDGYGDGDGNGNGNGYGYGDGDGDGFLNN